MYDSCSTVDMIIQTSALQIRSGNRDNFWIIFLIFYRNVLYIVTPHLKFLNEGSQHICMLSAKKKADNKITSAKFTNVLSMICILRIQKL